MKEFVTVRGTDVNNYKVLCKKQQPGKEGAQHIVLCPQNELWRQTEGGSDPGGPLASCVTVYALPSHSKTQDRLPPTGRF